MYVAAHYRIFCGADSVLCLPATSTMIVQAMQTCTVVVVVFFPLDTLQLNVSMFYPTPTKTHTSIITFVTFSKVNMHVSSNIALNLKYCAR